MIIIRPSRQFELFPLIIGRIDTCWRRIHSTRIIDFGKHVTHVSSTSFHIHCDSSVHKSIPTSSLPPHGITLLIPVSKLSSRHPNCCSAQSFVGGAPSITHMPVQPIRFVEDFRGDGQSAENWIQATETFFWLTDLPEDKRFRYALQHLSRKVMECVIAVQFYVENISGKDCTVDWYRLKVILRGIESRLFVKYSS